MPLSALVKNKIINTAINLFYNNGYHLTTMREIENISGVNKGNFYRYFSSKEELLKSICKPIITKTQYMIKNYEKRFDYDKDKAEILFNENYKIIADIITKDTKPFLILFTKSEGTEFTSVRINFANSIIKTYCNILKKIHPGKSLSTKIKNYISIIINNHIDGYINLAKNHIKNSWTKKHLLHFMKCNNEYLTGKFLEFLNE
jgi:hypothetical protein